LKFPKRLHLNKIYHHIIAPFTSCNFGYINFSLPYRLEDISGSNNYWDSVYKFFFVIKGDLMEILIHFSSYPYRNIANANNSHPEEPEPSRNRRMTLLLRTKVEREVDRIVPAAALLRSVPMKKVQKHRFLSN